MTPIYMFCRNKIIAFANVCLLITGCVCNVGAHGVPNQDILDKLEDIEDLLLMQNAIKNKSQPQPSGCNASFYKILYLNHAEGVKACVYKNFSRYSDGVIGFMYMVEEDNPSFYDGVLYSKSLISAQIDCVKKKVKLNGAELLDKNGKELKRFPIINPKYEDYGKIITSIDKYLCN